MVVNGEMKNKVLSKIFSLQWKQVDSMERYPLRTLEIKNEAASPALFEFLIQDHVTFWNYKKNGSSLPLPAILVTDSGNNSL